jgi:autotransporter-associated beta strand protein
MNAPRALARLRVPLALAAAVAVAVAGWLPTAAHAVIVTWDGGGPDANWTTPANWLGETAPQPGDHLIFPAAAARPQHVNDFPPATSFATIRIEHGATLVTGNPVRLERLVFQVACESCRPEVRVPLAFVPPGGASTGTIRNDGPTPALVSGLVTAPAQGELELVPAVGTIELSGGIADGLSLVRIAAGAKGVVLSGSGLHDGGTQLEQMSRLEIRCGDALGSGLVTLDAESELVLAGVPIAGAGIAPTTAPEVVLPNDLSIGAGQVTAHGSFGAGEEHFQSEGYTGEVLLVHQLLGDIQLDGGGARFVTAGASLRVSGSIAGPHPVHVSGGETVTFEVASSYSGGTTVAQGTLVLADGGALGTGAATVLGAGRLSLSGGITVGNAISLQGRLSATALANAVSGEVTLSGTGAVLAADRLALLTLTGNLSGDTAFTKRGDGQVSLQGPLLYTGIANIFEGNLRVEGANTTNGFVLADGALARRQAGERAYSEPSAPPGLALAQSLVGAIDARAGIVDVAVATAASLEMAAGTTFRGFLAGNGPGAHTRLTVTGNVVLDDPVLDLRGDYDAPLGEELVFLAPQGTLTGGFANLPEGAPVGAAEHTWDITYQAGDGNDVALGRVADGMFYTVPPCRIYDSRLGDGSALRAFQVRNVPGSGACGIPVTARAVSFNVTVAGATQAGNLKLYPADHDEGVLTSVLNFRAGQTRANNAVLPMPLDRSGLLSAVFGLQADGEAHLILDVNGFFQ